VLTAPDADSALTLLRNKDNHVGIVVTDFRMPGKTGGELLRQIAQEFPHIIRILVTAYADREMLLETVNNGEVFRIIEKPLEVELVRAALRLATDTIEARNLRQQRLHAIDETLSFLAHELNTPLAAILNFSFGIQQRISGPSLSAQQQSEIRLATVNVDNNARYCLSLLNSFIESIRNSGSLVDSSISGSARQLLKDLLDSYPLSLEQRGMIRVELKEDFPVTALPNCVSLVLSSLLSNSLRALESHPAPTIVFTISAGEQPYIQITDNGPGIPKEIQDKLFVDPVTTHADSGGTGWGLIFCKRIMQAFGGKITINSEQNQHTTVTLYFPPLTIT